MTRTSMSASASDLEATGMCERRLTSAVVAMLLGLLAVLASRA
jgi:hypothetical protein